jgi:NAD(P)-dependent dehydrogenase (short-subunit alcohol dehydrogenase family)
MILEGKVAVVTGGTRGIGAAVARALAEAGAAVLVCGRSLERAERAATTLRSAGHRVQAAACDVTDPDSVRVLAERAAALGAVDVLVNNAGASSSAPLAKLSLEEWNRMFAVNATGTFLCTQAFVPGMVERRWGRVINVASTAARTGGRYIAAYAAAKHAVLGFTRSVAEEVAAHGVTVNAVCPGYVDTEMTRESVARIMAKTGLSADEALGSLLGTTPQKRLIEPDEVAFVVRSLCDENARGIHGQAIVIDGGGLRA